jgi:hypothetical protein
VSALVTYAAPTPIVPLETRRYDGPMAPGDWVCHSEYGGRGIIVAINGNQMCVLWSVEPNIDPDGREMRHDLSVMHGI